MFEDLIPEKPKNHEEYDPDNPCDGCDMEGIFCDACYELQQEIENEKIWPLNDIDFDDLTPIYGMLDKARKAIYKATGLPEEFLKPTKK